MSRINDQCVEVARRELADFALRMKSHDPKTGDSSAGEPMGFHVAQAMGGKDSTIRTLLILAYNLGYDSGHNDTVEGGFTQVHPSEMHTYHGDVIDDAIRDGIFQPIEPPTK